MTDQTLDNVKIAILLANGFAEEEFAATQRRLLNAGAKVTVVSMENGLANGWHENGWGHYFPVDKGLSTALAADFDALFVPAGSRHIERLAGQPHAGRFTRGFVDGNKPMVLSGEAVNLLIVADRAKGRTVVGAGVEACAAEEAGLSLVDETTHTDVALMSMAGLATDDVAETVVSHVAANTEDVSEAA
ncbi:MAG: DJ-1/PfpI family protein [Pseudomonadota bacterium]